jgi:hypothetical protein
MRRTVEVPAWMVTWAAALVAAALVTVVVLIFVVAHVADLRCHG